jgi:putative ABC transport system ATP-binding protein
MTALRRVPRPGEANLVEARSVSREYHLGPSVVHALRDVSVDVPHGQLIVVQGRSGSGKTTLLNLIGGLDEPTSGKVLIDGRDLTHMRERERTELRRRRMGFIFQAFGLVPILTAAENVEIPMRLVRLPVEEREARVAMLLQLVGLGERARHRPHELSGGEQQRVAIARALANAPELLIADEPTGQLDSQTGRTIMTLLRSIVRSEGVTAIVATHDPLLVDLADRVIELSDGQVLTDSSHRGAPPDGGDERAPPPALFQPPRTMPSEEAPAPAGPPRGAPLPPSPPDRGPQPPRTPLEDREAPERSPFAPPRTPQQDDDAPERSPYAPPR